MGVNVADLFVSMGADLSEFDRKFKGMQSTLQETQGIVDQYGRKVQSAVQPIDNMSDATDRITNRSNALERQFGKLTSGTDFVAGGIRRLRSSLEAIVWGTIIGAVAGLVIKLTEWALATKDVEKETEDLLIRLNSQLNFLDPMRQKTEAFTRAQFEQTRVQFLLNQEIAKSKLLDMIDQLNRLGRASEGHLGVTKGLTMIIQNLWNVIKGDQGAIDKNMIDAMNKAGLEAQLLGLNLTAVNEILMRSAPTMDQYTAGLTAVGGKFGALNKEEQKGLMIAIPLAAAFQTVNGAIADNILLQENLLKVKRFLIALDDQQTESLMTGDAAWQIRMRNLEQERDGIQEIARGHKQWLDQLNQQIVLHNALAGSYGPVLQKMALQNEMFKAIHDVSQGLGQAVSQWLIYGQNFRDSMVNFFRQWAAQSIAYIIQVETEMLILRSLGFGATVGAGIGAGPSAAPVPSSTPSINLPQGKTGGFVTESGMAVIHKGERILTKDETNAAGVTVVKQKIIFPIYAMDGASVERVLRTNAGTIQDIIGKSVRRNRTFARELS